MIFSPPKSVGLAIGVAALTILALLDFFCIALVRVAPPSPLTFSLICLVLLSPFLMAWLAYGCYALARARYVVSRNALVVDWGGRRELIPMGMIDHVRAGADVEGPLRPRALTWPGNVVGHATHPSLGEVEFLAAADKAGLVLVGYADRWLAISPLDPQAFLAEFEARRAEGVVEAIPPESAQPGFRQWPLWRDWLALGLIALGGLGALALVGYLTLIFPQLPPEIALRFNAQGQPDRFGPPTGLFLLPIIGGLAWALNTLGGVWLHRRADERSGSYLLFGATVFVQALVWVAALSLLTAGRT
jgi:hypothetical protein